MTTRKSDRGWASHYLLALATSQLVADTNECTTFEGGVNMNVNMSGAGRYPHFRRLISRTNNRLTLQKTKIPMGKADDNSGGTAI